MTTVQIPDEVANEYALRAKAANRDPEILIREALIAQLEDFEDVEIAMARLAEPKPTLSLEEVMRNLGLDD